MIFSLPLAAMLAAVALGSANRSPLKLKTSELEAILPPTPDRATNNFAALDRRPGKPKSSSYLHSLLGIGSKRNSVGHNKPVGVAKLNGVWPSIFFANVSFDKQELSLYVDTGSPWVWTLAGNITCLYQNRTVIASHPESRLLSAAELWTMSANQQQGHGSKECDTAPSFQGSPSGGVLPGLNFFAGFLGGTEANGTVGVVDFTVAGITVKEQEVGLVNRTVQWYDDETSSGLLGLSYPKIRRKLDNTKTLGSINPSGHPHHPNNKSVITNMQERDPPITSFSMAPQSKFPLNSSTGYLAFGGLPPVSFKPPFASVPLQTTAVTGTKTLKPYAWYTVIPDAYVYEGYHRPTYNGSVFNYTRGPEGKEAAVIVDSGTSFSYLPNEVVANVSRLFHPPAVLLDDGNYWAECNATVPEFGVKLGGETFWLDKENMLQQVFSVSVNFTTSPPSIIDTNSTEGVKYCATGIQAQDGFDDSTFIYILGNTFLNNVVTVYDVGAAEMRFAALDQ